MTAVLDGDLAGVQQLLDLGRWTDKPDSNGLTPLMIATLNRDILMVRLLLERGADPNLQAPGGDTALDMALELGEGEIERVLQDRGAR
jgi:ankyrin repeat protein